MKRNSRRGLAADVMISEKQRPVTFSTGASPTGAYVVPQR
jgi:hypothetical protein